MPGFVDEVSQDVIRGWYVADAPPAGRCHAVMISINGEARYGALCQDTRPDVVDAGFAGGVSAGFLAPLALQIGDLVSVRALKTGRLLGGGLTVVMPPYASDGFLNAKTGADLPAFRELIQPLRAHLEFQAFRPLFGHAGKLSALCMKTPAGRVVVHCQRPRGNALWLERIHRQILEPNGVAAPSLNAVIVHGETASLVVDHVDGQALGHFVEGAEQAFRDTIAAAMRLASADGNNVVDGDRRGQRAFDTMLRSVCLTALKQQRWREFGLLLRMARVAYRLPRVFSHGDLHPENVLIETSTGKPVFIDWDHAARLPLGFDLSRLLMSVPPALAETWIDASSKDRASGGAEASRERRLGWLIMTYFARSKRQPDFHASEEGGHLRQRFKALTSPRRKAARVSSAG